MVASSSIMCSRIQRHFSLFIKFCIALLSCFANIVAWISYFHFAGTEQVTLVCLFSNVADTCPIVEFPCCTYSIFHFLFSCIHFLSLFWITNFFTFRRAMVITFVMSMLQLIFCSLAVLLIWSMCYCNRLYMSATTSSSSVKWDSLNLLFSLICVATLIESMSMVNW